MAYTKSAIIPSALLPYLYSIYYYYYYYYYIYVILSYPPLLPPTYGYGEGGRKVLYSVCQYDINAINTFSLILLGDKAVFALS